MSVYKPVYSCRFKEHVNDLAASREIKNGLDKAISFILEKPYYKAVKLKGEDGIMRKHICSNRFRIFYYVDDGTREIEFAMLRPKNKNTYKNL